MKKEYIYSILSLTMLLLGTASFITALLLTVLLASTKSILMLFGVCFVLLGITSYVKHHKNYLKIKDLKNEDVSVIAHWIFKPHSSHSIDALIYGKKNSNNSTIILTLLLLLVISGCIALSGEQYSTYISLVLTLISLMGIVMAFTLNTHYYNTKLASESEAIIGEDCIYFIDDLYTLHKSIYFLEDIRINSGDETTLQFLYGDYDLFTGPMYTINIPIPEGELVTARMLQSHYLDLIHYRE